MEREWRARLDGLRTWQPPAVPTLIVSPHPDDETLGAGGMIAALRAQGTPVSVVAVTDGENAYADYPGLARIRRHEQTAALHRLCVPEASIHRLHLPDSGLAACEDRIVAGLLPLVHVGMHIVAPWPGDFHPDHEACGRAAAIVAQQKHATLTSYFFWTWHRGTVALLNGLPLVAVPLEETSLAAKREALLCHRSQLQHESGEPILPIDLLGPVVRPYEVFLPS
jgi:LmbE family N-acetylglucosaminyl deacetylase